MVKKHWILGHLNDVIDSLVAGVSVNSGEDDASGNFFILKTSAISKGKLNLSEKKPVLPREVARLKCSLRQETILISRMNTPELVGECAYVPCDDPRIYLPDRIWQTNFKKDVDVSAKWLNYLLSSKKYRSLIQNCATGTSNSMKNISKEQLLGLEILYPSFREQTSIAEALSDIDNLISSLQKLIEKKKAIKQGAMQELLTGKKRLPGFNREWELKYLKEMIAPRKERINPAEIDNRRCIELEHVEPKSGRIMGYCESKMQKSLKTVFYPNDILWGKLRPYLQKYAHPQFGGVCSTEFWVFNAIDNNVCNDFMYYVLQSESFVSAANSTTGTKMPRADWKLVQELEVKIPVEEKEQRAIAQILSDMDSEIEQLEKKLAKYQQIKQGMMQELLTGRIRLVNAAGNEQPKTQAVQDKQPQPAHNQYFDDAVMIAGIVNAFYSEKYRLGRKKVQKLLYLVRRKEQADISAFHKKAAGPYADVVRYKGGEPIAQKNHYIQVKTSDKGSCFAKGEKMEQALAYLLDWGKQADINWLVSQFQYTNVDELELLATVDMAMCDLCQESIEVSVSAIKDLIRSNKEWRDKLKKTYFKDADIQRAIKRCRELFPGKEG